MAYSKDTVLEEKLTLRIKADGSGDVYLPVAGYSVYGIQDCDYNWKVSIDGGEETTYEGIGSTTAIRVGYGLTPLSVHTVTVKPVEEEYGWLRAFGYKGTNVASSLINIISDKSYKGYAVSGVFTGDYYKAYQYYGCTNLINTDEELLPDTLEIIGDYYRYCEYYNCSSLVSNAEEKILKTVKVIGQLYRGQQYRNCTGLKKINMRAINRASVGANYRYYQFNKVATDRNPVEIYIEGGIEEGGDWGLADANVKGIYVYKDLVSDYQTKLSSITSSKIQKNAEWDGNEYEFIEYIALADSTGKIRIPIGGLSTTMSQDCPYDWMISIDGGEETEYTGTGDDSYFSIGSDLEEGSEHRIIIKPKTIGWGWGRAFGFLSTGAQAYIKELIHDSYKCYAVSRIDTGAHYKHATYTGCTNLVNSYEKLPTSVTTVGDYYMKECYAGCTGLKIAFWEVMHYDATIGTDYRHHEYTGCTSLEVHQGIAGYTGSTYPTNYKYEYLSGSGNNMDVYITRYEALNNSLTNALGLSTNKVNYIYSFIDDVYHYQYDGNWSNVDADKFQGWYYNYVVYEYKPVNKYTKLVSTITINDGLRYSSDTSWWLNYGIGVNRSKNWNNLVFGGEYTKRNSSGVGVMTINATTSKEGNDRVLTGVGNNTGTNGWGGSAWSGGNIPFANRPTFTPIGGIYGTYQYNGSNYDYYGIAGVGRWQGGTSEHNAFSISRNYKYLFGYGEYGYSLYHTDAFNNFSSPTRQSIGGMSGNLEFSDDGLTMWRGDGSSYTSLTEYKLTSPRRVETAVATGNTLSVQGQICMSLDGKYLFARNGTTIYQYTYE